MLAIVLALFLLIAVICFQIGWRSKGVDNFSKHRARGGFYLSVAFSLLIGVFIFIRMGAVGRLKEKGIEPHPNLRSVSGLAAGQQSRNKTWVFETSLAGRDMLEFYRDAQHMHGWKLVEDESMILKFENGSKKLVITGGSDSTLIFRITELGVR